MKRRAPRPVKEKVDKISEEGDTFTIKPLANEDLCRELQCIINDDGYSWDEGKQALSDISNKDPLSTAEAIRAVYVLLRFHLSDEDRKLKWRQNKHNKLYLFLKFLTLIFYVGCGSQERPKAHTYDSQLKYSESAKVKVIKKLKQENKEIVVVQHTTKFNRVTAEAQEHCVIVTMPKPNLTNSHVTGASQCSELDDKRKRLAGSYLLFQLFESYLKSYTEDADSSSETGSSDESEDEKDIVIKKKVLKSLQKENKLLKTKLLYKDKEIEQIKTSVRQEKVKLIQQSNDNLNKALMLQRQIVNLQKELKFVKDQLKIQVLTSHNSVF